MHPKHFLPERRCAMPLADSEGGSGLEERTSSTATIFHPSTLLVEGNLPEATVVPNNCSKQFRRGISNPAAK